MIPGRKLLPTGPALALFPALALGCAGGVGTSDTGVGGLEPNITVEPQELEFGWVEEGQEKAVSLIISNDGPGSLEVSGLTFSGEPSAYYSLVGVSEADLPLIVQADNGAIEVGVAFAPPRGQFGPGTLTVESDDPDTPTIDVTLKGNTGIPYSTLVTQSPNSVAHNYYIAGDHGMTGMDMDLGDDRNIDWDGGAVAWLNRDPLIDVVLSFPGSPRGYTLYTRTNAGSYLQGELSPGADVELRFAADLDDDGHHDLVGSDPSPAYEGGSDPGTSVFWMRNTTPEGAAEATFAPAEVLADLAPLAAGGARVLWATSARDFDAGDDPMSPRHPDLLFAVLPASGSETEVWWIRNHEDGTLEAPEQLGTLPTRVSFLEGVDFRTGIHVDLLYGDTADPGSVYAVDGYGDGTFGFGAPTLVGDLDETAEDAGAGWPDTLSAGATRLGEENIFETLVLTVPGATGWDLWELVTDNAGGGIPWPVAEGLTQAPVLVPDDHPRP